MLARKKSAEKDLGVLLAIVSFMVSTFSFILRDIYCWYSFYQENPTRIPELRGRISLLFPNNLLITCISR